MNEKGNSRVFTPNPDGDELAEQFIAAFESNRPDIGCWIGYLLLFSAFLLLDPETASYGLVGIAAFLLLYLLIMTFFHFLLVKQATWTGVGCALLYDPFLIILAAFWWKWVIWLSGSRGLRYLRPDSIIAPVLLGYDLRIDDASISALAGSAIAEELEFCKLHRFKAASLSRKAPRQFQNYSEKIQPFVEDLEIANVEFPRIYFGDIRTIMERGDNLEIYTQDDRIVKIPSAFPLDEILEVLSDKVPEAVERGRKLS